MSKGYGTGSYGIILPYGGGLTDIASIIYNADCQPVITGSFNCGLATIVYDVLTQGETQVGVQGSVSGYGSGLYGTRTFGDVLGGTKPPVKPPTQVQMESDLEVYGAENVNFAIFDKVTCGVQ